MIAVSLRTIQTHVGRHPNPNLNPIPNPTPYKYTTQVDILPTIADLAGIPLPTGETPFDGVSMVPLLNAAGSSGGSGGGRAGGFVNRGAPVEKDAAFTQYVDEEKDRDRVAREREREEYGERERERERERR